MAGTNSIDDSKPQQLFQISSGAVGHLLEPLYCIIVDFCLIFFYSLVLFVSCFLEKYIDGDSFVDLEGELDEVNDDLEDGFGAMWLRFLMAAMLLPSSSQ
jgi:hypothetical protein